MEPKSAGQDMRGHRRNVTGRHAAALILLSAILAIAAYLRFRGLDYSEMGSDQSILYSIAMTWVNGGALPLAANKSSAGIMNPPLVEYLIGLPLMVRTTILSAVRFQALLSTAAVLALYLFSAPLFGRRVALLATFLFAFNPWSVFYSRFIWNPNPIPFFSTLLLGSLLTAVAGHGRRPIYLALSFLWLAAITQLHLSGLVLLLVVGLVLLIFHRRWWPAGEQKGSWKSLWPLLLGISLFLLLYVPFILYEAAAGFSDVQAAWNALSGGSAATGDAGQAAVNAASWLLTLDLATGAGFSRGHAVWREAVWPAFWLLTLARWLFAGALAYAAAAPLLWRWRHPQRRLPSRLVALLILALWLIVPVLAYIRHTVYLQHYYFLYLLPAPFLLLALLVDEAGRRLKERAGRPALRLAGSTLLAAPLVLLGAWQVHVNYVGLDLLEEGEFRPERTTAEVQELVDRSRRILAEHPSCDLVIVAEAGTLEKSPLGLVRDFVHPRPVRFVEAGRGYIVPDGCSLYLRAAGDPLVDEWLAATGQPLTETEEASSELSKERAFFRVDGEEAPHSPPLQSWENGLALLSAEVETPPAAGQPLTLVYRWHVEAPAPSADYHFFNHVLNPTGELVAQEDAAAIDARNWREGDILVTRFSIPLPAELPPGRYTLQIGQYIWPEITRVPLAEASPETTYEVTAFEIP